MHTSVLKWAADRIARDDLAGRSTLEVGSLFVNGGVRGLFTGAYVGVDIVNGLGVDLVVTRGRFPFNPNTFAVVVSTEMLEHDLRPWKTVAEMWRVMQPGGHLLLTCRGFDQRGAFAYHDPPDFWRYSREALDMILVDAGFVDVHIEPDPQTPGWFVRARKEPV